MASLNSMLTKLSTVGTATSSRYNVDIIPPNVIKSSTYLNTIAGFSLGEVLNFYCESVNTPTKQITTAQQKDHGVGYSYPTGTVYDELQISFLSPKNLGLNLFFEEWYNSIHNDYGNEVAFYDDVVSPRIIITKEEKGRYQPELTGWWMVENALPYNISSYQLSSNRTQLLRMRVSFKYERYRFNSDLDISDQAIVRRMNAKDGRRIREGPTYSEDQLPDLTQNKDYFNRQTIGEKQRIRDRYGYN